MAHISKRSLKREHLDTLFDEFNAVIASLQKTGSREFFDELLGPEEKIMLVKRLTAIMMFMEGNSSYRVWQLLNLSPSTAERIRLNYQRGAYKNIERQLRSKRINYVRYWKVLEKVLQAGMPPMGRGRWKSVFKS